MSWTNLCVEAFCFGDTDENGNYPCGRDCPSHLCLKNNYCPHFAYAETTEREVALFTPMKFIIKDKIGIWAEVLYWKLRWWFWDRLWFNRRKVEDSLNNIGTISNEDCPMLVEMEDENKSEFENWFRGINEL
jgi:hypothetical protein